MRAVAPAHPIEDTGVIAPRPWNEPDAAAPSPAPAAAASAPGRDLRSAAALRLALDAATIEIAGALDAAGVRSILLKGAAVATRLYDAGERSYVDIDLLVDPARVADAERIVAGLGYVSPLAAARERWDHHAITWHRGQVTLDLHHRLFLVAGDAAAMWAVLSAHTRRLTLGGSEIEVLSDPALALVLVAHDVHHGTMAKPRQDLEQALARFDRGAWEGARDLAGRLDMLDLLAAGLRRDPRGHALADELGLPATYRADVHRWLGGPHPLVDGFARLRDARSPASALRLLASELVPSPAFMRYTQPRARAGRAGLALAYVLRAAHLVGRAPGALAYWRRAGPAAVDPTQRSRARTRRWRRG